MEDVHKSREMKRRERDALKVKKYIKICLFKLVSKYYVNKWSVLKERVLY